MFVITSEGCEFLTRHGGDVDSASLNRLIQARQQQLYSEHQDAGQTIVADIADTDPSDATPHEQLEELYRELDDRLAEDILERVIGATPEQFERLTVRLLESMEYGEGQAIGRRGDQGIDGIINQDPLGLEKVYIQAKRWQNQVGEPEIRTFAGSLEAQGANKGVIH